MMVKMIGPTDNASTTPSANPFNMASTMRY
jgi:hypothetical protein